MSDKYQYMADRINSIPVGMALKISQFDIWDLPGMPDWAMLSNITTGFDRVKESVVGSSYPDLWTFRHDPDGGITVFRH